MRIYITDRAQRLIARMMMINNCFCKFFPQNSRALQSIFKIPSICHQCDIPSLGKKQIALKKKESHNLSHHQYNNDKVAQFTLSVQNAVHQGDNITGCGTVDARKQVLQMCPGQRVWHKFVIHLHIRYTVPKKLSFWSKLAILFLM